MGSCWLQPGARINVHHDSGDAEKGLGVGLEAGVSWIDLQLGVDAQLHLSAVLAHEEERLRGHGLSGSLARDPRLGTLRGAKFELASSMRGVNAGTVDRLLAD